MAVMCPVRIRKRPFCMSALSGRNEDREYQAAVRGGRLQQIRAECSSGRSSSSWSSGPGGMFADNTRGLLRLFKTISPTNCFLPVI